MAYKWPERVGFQMIRAEHGGNIGLNGCVFGILIHVVTSEPGFRQRFCISAAVSWVSGGLAHHDLLQLAAYEPRMKVSFAFRAHVLAQSHQTEPKST